MSYSPFPTIDAQRRYLARRPKDQRKDVAARLADIRARGFEDTPSTLIEGVRNLCAPVFDSRGIAAAITSGFIQQADDSKSAEDVLSLLRASALELSGSLGFRTSESEILSVLNLAQQEAISK